MRGGYNFQSGNMVYGFTTSASAGSVQGVSTNNCASCDTRLLATAALVLRAGVVTKYGLFYGGLGAVQGQFKYTLSGRTSKTSSVAGTVIALGYERPLKGKWLLQLETRLMKFPEQNNVPSSGLAVKADNFQVISIGIAKRF